MKKSSFIYIIIAGILWGTSGIFVHYLTPHGFTSFQMTAVRALVSFTCMAVYALITDREAFRVNIKQLLLFAAIGASLFLTASLYYTSISMTSSSTAVVLMYTAPIYVVIFSALFLGERFSRLKLLSVGCMLIGCCLVSGIVGGLKFDAIGILAGALSGITYAVYNILTKIATQHKCKTVSLTLYCFLFVALIALFVSEPMKIIDNAVASPTTIPLLLLIGIVTFVAPYFLYTLAMRDVPAGTATALGAVEPMAATVFGVLLFKDPFNVFSAIGIVLVVLAVFLIGKAENGR